MNRSHEVEETHYTKKLREGFSFNLLFFLSGSLDLMILRCFSCSLVWWCSLPHREIEFFTLDLAQQNRRTRDVTLLNCFENVLTNEIVWDSGLDKVEETHYMKKLHKGFSSNSLFFLSGSLDLMIFHCFSCSLIWWCSLSRREIKSWNSSSSHLI